MTTKPTEGWLPSLARRCADAVAARFAASAPTPEASGAQRVVLLCLLVAAAVLRFWDLGTYGLHTPDEATTALPAIDILREGVPRFPGGMLYTRAVPQSYLIAASAALFGPSEWALRLPSALCGILLVWLAWRVGQRFLSPAWNLAFAAVVAFLPGTVEDSQVARMYIFMLATLAAYSLFIFRWERTGARLDLALAIGALMLGVQLNHLAIFGSLVLLFPVLLRPDAQRVRDTLWALLAVAVYFVYMRWTGSPYPLPLTDWVMEPSTVGRAPPAYGLRFQPLLTAGALVVAVLGGVLLRRDIVRRAAGQGGFGTLVAAAVVAGFLLLAALFWHVGLLFIAGALVAAWRLGARSWFAPALLLLGVGALFAIDLAWLQANGPGSLRKSVGVLIGQPSIWQYVAAAGHSVVATVVLAVALPLAVVRFARGGVLADHWLFFLLAVAVPLFALGATDWFFPRRYTEFALLPLVLTALAVLQSWQRSGERWRWLPAVAAVLVVNPAALAQSIKARGDFPDHRAQARYLQSLPLGPRDIVIAEEVMYQTWYLGHIDYWLCGRNMAYSFIERVNGVIVDQYAHAPLISSAAELQAVIDRRDRGAIYIVGSGESMEDGRRYARGPELSALLESDRFKSVYVDRQGVRIWKIDAPAATGESAR